MGDVPQENNELLCIFCDEPAGSKEDIFPEWMRKILVRKSSTYLNTVIGPSRRPLIWVGSDVNLVTRRVCKTCNHEWMSRRQNQVRDILKPMLTAGLMSSARRVLKWREQERIARWAAMTVTTLRYADRINPNVATTRGRRLALRAGGSAIPDGMRVFLAYLDDHRFPFNLTFQVVQDAPLGPDDAPPVMATMACGRLVVKVADRSIKGANFVADTRWLPYCVEISHGRGPRPDVVWPPRRALDLETFEGFAILRAVQDPPVDRTA